MHQPHFHFHSLSLYLSLSISLSLSLSPSLPLSLSRSLSLSLSLSPSRSPCPHLCIHVAMRSSLPTSGPIRQSLDLFMHPSSKLRIYLSKMVSTYGAAHTLQAPAAGNNCFRRCFWLLWRLSTYPQIYPQIYLSTCLPTYLSIYPSINGSICLSIYLSNLI